MRQGKEESMKKFILRFKKENLEVDNPDEKTMLNTLMRGVKADGPLMAKMAIRPNGLCYCEYKNFVRSNFGVVAGKPFDLLKLILFLD
jgi:hypothetical protein